MSLSEEQKQTVAQWMEDGLGLADVQTKISDEFSITMTYMDVRFLIDDLNIELKSEEKVEESDATDPDVVQDLEHIGGVSVELDSVQRPGALISGNVIFGDGVRATWQIDHMGRINIDPSQEGYKPSDEDMNEFRLNYKRSFKITESGIYSTDSFVATF